MISPEKIHLQPNSKVTISDDIKLTYNFGEEIGEIEEIWEDEYGSLRASCRLWTDEEKQEKKDD